MIKFLKEHGNPITIFVNSTKFEEVNKEFKGFETIITNENNVVLSKFVHKNLHDRIYYVRGFFCALRMQNEKSLEK